MLHRGEHKNQDSKAAKAPISATPVPQLALDEKQSQPGSAPISSASPGGAETRAALGGLSGILEKAGAGKPAVDVKAAAPAPAAKLKTGKLGGQYAGEDKVAGFRAGQQDAFAPGKLIDKNSPAYTTHYYSPEERKASEVSTQGLLTRPDGSLYDTQDKKAQLHKDRAGAPEQGFVMSPEGTLHTFDGGHRPTNDGKKYISTHHSSPLAGGDVAGAGTINAEKGIVREITDSSGHYKPSGDLTHQTVSKLADSVNMVKPDFKDKDTKQVGPRSADVVLTGKNEGEQNLALRYRQYLQTGGNEKQARNKAALNQEIQQNGGKRTDIPKKQERDRKLENSKMAAHDPLAAASKQAVDLKKGEAPPSSPSMFDLAPLASAQSLDRPASMDAADGSSAPPVFFSQASGGPQLNAPGSMAELPASTVESAAAAPGAAAPFSIPILKSSGSMSELEDSIFDLKK